MSEERTEVFPSDPNKTYGLMEVVEGTSNLVDKGPDDTVLAIPHAMILEILLFLGTGLFVLLFSMFLNSPLEEMANPDVTPNPAKAPWYFLNLQEMLAHFHPVFGAVILPVLAIALLIALPYIDRDRVGIGRWFSTANGKRICLYTALATMLVVPITLIIEFNLNLEESALPPFLSKGIIPVAIIIFELWLLSFLIGRFLNGTKRDTIMAIFTAFVVTVVILTLIGTWFRGPGFGFYMPWDIPPPHSG